mmetsp:Transcript_12585/g.34332  ORF Transcript_12585/g.34332 Transcript_12585/m.34332 type:complete len:410 (-) Transcript_12585:579-1808(-)|eukprot:scaffold86077_cov31-Tisochrysis_lutea.AAC.1
MVRLASLAMMAGSAAGCSMLQPEGLKIESLQAHSSHLLSLVLKDYPPSPPSYAFYSYTGEDDDLPSHTLEYDWQEGTLVRQTRQRATTDGIGPLLDLSPFDVTFEEQGVEVVVDGATHAFSLPQLEDPELADFWYGNGHFYFIYPVRLGQSSTQLSELQLAVCPRMQKSVTCIMHTFTPPAGWPSIEQFMRETRQYPIHVYEHVELVAFPSLDTCIPEAFYYFNSTHVTRADAVDDFLSPKAVFNGPPGPPPAADSPHLVFSGRRHADDTGESLILQRTNYATGAEEIRVFDAEVVRNTINGDGGPSAPASPPPPAGDEPSAPPLPALPVGIGVSSPSSPSPLSGAGPSTPPSPPPPSGVEQPTSAPSVEPSTSPSPPPPSSEVQAEEQKFPEGDLIARMFEMFAVMCG